MSAEAMGYALQQSPFKGTKLLCHIIIADVVNSAHNYEFWMSMTNLAQAARCKRQYASKLIREMCDERYLKLIEERPGGTNKYQFLFPDTPVIYGKGVKRSDTQVSKDLTGGVKRSDTQVSKDLTGGVHSVAPNSIELKDELKENPDSSSEKKSATSAIASESNDDDEGEPLMGSARRLSARLAAGMNHVHGYIPKVTGRWAKDMGLLLERGPTEWENPQPIDPEVVEQLIVVIFTQTERSSTGFRWADQITEPAKLRQHWVKLVSWAQGKKPEEQEEAPSDSWMVRFNPDLMK